MSVVGYSKTNSFEGKYDIKICSNSQHSPYMCDIQSGHYRMINDFPQTQFFANFPATADNVNVFIPSRVVEDTRMFKQFVLDQMLVRPKCLTMDPCNLYTKPYCCSDDADDNDKVVVSSVSSEESDTKEALNC